MKQQMTLILNYKRDNESKQSLQSLTRATAAQRVDIMKYILLLYLIAVEAKLRIYLTDAPLQRIGGRIYKKRLLTDHFKSPKELTYDSSSRNLFFMYMDDVIQNSGRAVINVITKQAKKIHGIEKNKAIAVDPDTSDVYFGSEDGLYKYDPVTNEARNIGLYNVNIMKLVVRNNEMFLLDANNHMLYKVFNEGKTAVKLINMKTVMEFEIDDDRNVYFVTMCGVYCAIDGHEIVKNTDLSIVYNFIVSDGKTYGVAEDGIYALDCVNGTAKLVAELDFIPRSITFGDYGDIYYSEDDFIYKLSPISSYLVYNVHRNVK